MPIGSIEQHCNAPLGTDFIIADAVARRVCSRLLENNYNCIMMPGLPYGFSPEWSSCPGTITLRMETMRNVLWDILRSLSQTNIKYIIIINGHGGNSTLLEATSREWNSMRKRPQVVVIDYWRVAGLSLGHCDETEEKLLSEALGGEEIKCECRRGISFLPSGIKSLRLPNEVCGLGGSLNTQNNINNLDFDHICNIIYENIKNIIKNSEYYI